MKNKLFIYASLIVVALVLIPSAMADEATGEDSAAHYFQHLVTGITALFKVNPDANTFIREVMNSFPVIAVFIIILVIIHYVSSKVIFKDAQNEKYGTLLGVGMALIAIWNQTIFSWIMGIGTTAIIIIFFAVIFGAIYFAFSVPNIGLTHLSESITHLNAQQTQEIEAKKEMEKAHHAYEMEAKTEKREIAEINGAMDAINSLHSNYANVAKGLQAVGTVLARLAGPSGSSVSETRNLVESISRSLSGVGITVRNESRQFKELDKHIAKLQREVVAEENNNNDVALQRMNTILSNAHMQLTDDRKNQFVVTYSHTLNDMNKKELKYFEDIAVLKTKIEEENKVLIEIINEHLIPLISDAQYPQAIQVLRDAIQQNQEVMTLFKQASIYLSNLRTEENRQRAIELQMAGILARERISLARQSFGRTLRGR
jgi:outer membrane murein-binding lipoprotein Lpp